MIAATPSSNAILGTLHDLFFLMETFMATILGSAKSLSRATAADSSAADVSFGDASVFNTTLMVPGGAGEGLALTLFGSPVATTLKSAGTGAGSESAPALGNPQSGPDVPSSYVSAGLHINLIPDASVANAPATFSSEIRQAADLIEAAFSDPITINIRYGWGTYNNQPASNLIGGNFAEGGDIGGQNVDYPTLKSWLTSDASSTEDNTAIAHFPGSVANSFHVATAQLKALGHFTGDPNAVDGAIGWGTAWTSNFIDGALHELTHAMGRIFQDGFHYVMDLFRYDAPGHFQWTGRQPAYLSIDGGATKLADFGVSTDFGDFRPGGVQGPDPFNEQVSGNNILTPVDITNMDLIGFNRANGSPRTPPDDFANSLSDTTHPFGALGVNGAVTGTLEVAGDRDWFRVSLVAGTTYVINLQGQTAGGGTLEDPYLRVHNTAGAVLAENDDIQPGVNRDSQLVFQAQTTGVYYFEAGAFNDGYTGTYRLSANSNSDDFANSLADTAHPLGAVPVNGSHTGTLEVTGDRDWFSIQVNAGTTYDVNLQGLHAGAGTLEDPYLRIHNSSGTLVAENDDIDLGINRDSHLTFQATTTGTYYIEAGAFDDNYTGTYRASINSVGAGSVSIDDVSITEGNFGTKFATFTATRSGGAAAFDVNFTTANGSATTADHDYVANSGTLHFGTGVNTQTISVAITGDTKIEANETFFVNLSGATNGATISDSLAIGTIVDDDGNHLRDFNADTQSDLVWRNDSGPVSTWDMHDRGFGAVVIANVSNDWHIAGTGDFNGDRTSDLVWRNDSGAVSTWDMHDRSFGAVVIASVSNDWHIAGTGDFDGDRNSDILWRNDNGAVATWDMHDRGFGAVVIASVSNDWHIAGTGDFDGDGKSDILWRNDNGAVATWDMHDRSFGAVVIANVSNDWHIAGTGDFNGDGNSDILWRNDSGAVATWDMHDRSFGAVVIANVSNDWHIAGTGDFDGDGNSDIAWRNDSGAVATWDMHDRSFGAAVIAAVPNDWHIV
jgi:hypothetical protein